MSALRRVHLSVTPLESRDTPSTMVFGGGSFLGKSGNVNLSVTFSGTNAITWSTSPGTTPAAFASGASTLGGNLSITLLGCGTSTAGTPGNVGNSVSIDLNGQTLTGNLAITTGNCDDTITVFGGTVSGQVTINTNGGDDAVTISGGTSASGPMTIGKNLKIAEGAGNDSIAFGGPALKVGGNASINMGPGNNGYSLASLFSIGGNLQMQAGAGNDPFNQLGIAGSSIGGNATVLAGNGNNGLLLPAGLTIFGNTTYVGGTGSDGVIDGALINGNLLCLLGAGNDRFIYAAAAPIVGGKAFISGGPVLADIYIPLTTPSWPNTVIGFP